MNSIVDQRSNSAHEYMTFSNCEIVKHNRLYALPHSRFIYYTYYYVHYIPISVYKRILVHVFSSLIYVIIVLQINLKGGIKQTVILTFENQDILITCSDR